MSERIVEKAALEPGVLDGAKLVVGYTSHTTVDEYGRRGGLVGVYLDRERAINTNARAGWYNGPGELAQVNVLVLKDGRKFVLDSMIEFKDFDINLPEDRENQRKAARAKLTDDEASLLGIK